jgi:mono/diheme cytochrome c family protein
MLRARLVLSLTLIASLVAVSTAPMLVLAQGSAQTKPEIKQGVAADVSPTDGRGMFQSYCAPCHGVTAKGDGPAAAALTPKPANLTEFAKRRGGKFSARDFEDKMQGVAMSPAHGNSAMPVWGPVFRQLGNEPLRVANLRSYVETLQVK